MPIVQTLTDLFAPWQTAYSDSKVISTAVTSVHILALLGGGGLAIAADRATLRALKGDDADRRRQLAELRAVHRPVLVALALLFVSGAALAAADVETFATSPFFWVKLSLVALLLANGLVLERTEAALGRGEGGTPALWNRLRVSSWSSLVLWGATTLAGTVLVGAA